MHEGILTVNIESGMYEILLTEFDERLPLFNGDDFSIMIDGHWKNTKMGFSETEDDWYLEGIDHKDWGLGSAVRVDLSFEE
jgi:hypothetical protein